MIHISRDQLAGLATLARRAPNAELAIDATLGDPSIIRVALLFGGARFDYWLPCNGRAIACRTTTTSKETAWLT